MTIVRSATVFFFFPKEKSTMTGSGQGEYKTQGKVGTPSDTPLSVLAVLGSVRWSLRKIMKYLNNSQ